ncbi:hypothetical protein [Stenomitos frigidus]|uniref:Uncharacterized protein n=1 Tax=Stenomitos frigidus ULC18 TaxID=2107698 RepID=A0A2T1E2W8_9CYAN|nr:hypothetical protein [Stenomitos frigidus]PSB26964.1 hypothetical protein C7B82_17535 [Stenomitos frigidus ULC18]
MTKLLRTAIDNAGSNLVRYAVIFGATLCLVGVVSTLVQTLLPLLQILVPLLAVWWLWQRYRKVQNRQQKHLHTTFYRLLQEHQGRMTLLDFAMTAEIPAIAARYYLDNRAKEFAARFEVTEQGDVVYVFSTLQFSRMQPSPTATPVASEDSMNELQRSKALSQAELAKRLGVAAKTVSRKKHLSTLSDWTQTRDPNGVSWSYDAQAQRFFPVSDRPSAQSETEHR